MRPRRQLSFAIVLIVYAAVLVGCDSFTWMLVDEDDPEAIRTYLREHPAGNYRTVASAALATAEFGLSPSMQTALDMLVNEAISGRGPRRAKSDALEFLDAQNFAQIPCETDKIPIQLNLIDSYKNISVDEGLKLDYWLDVAGFTPVDESHNQLNVHIRGQSVGVAYEKVGTLYQSSRIQGEMIWNTPDRPLVSGRDDLMAQPSYSFLVSVGGWNGLSEDQIAKLKTPSLLSLKSGMDNAYFDAKICARVLAACPSAVAFEACGRAATSSRSTLARYQWRLLNEETAYAIGTAAFGGYDAQKNLIGALRLMDSPAAKKFLIALSPRNTEARRALIGYDSPEFTRFLKQQMPRSSGAYLHTSLFAVPYLTNSSKLRGAVNEACEDQTSSELVEACDAAIRAMELDDQNLNSRSMQVGTTNFRVNPRWTNSEPDHEAALKLQYVASLKQQVFEATSERPEIEINQFESFQLEQCDCELVFIEATVPGQVRVGTLLGNARNNAQFGIFKGKFSSLIELSQITSGGLEGVLTEFAEADRKRTLGILLSDGSMRSNFVQIALIERSYGVYGQYERAREEIVSQLRITKIPGKHQIDLRAGLKVLTN